MPMPEVALKDERYSGEERGNDATDSLGTKMQDDACHETAKANEQTLIGTVALREYVDKAHGRTTHTTGESNEYPHHEDNVLFQCAMPCAFVVLVEEIHHQWNTKERDARPKPHTPVFVQQLQG